MSALGGKRNVGSLTKLAEIAIRSVQVHNYCQLKSGS